MANERRKYTEEFKRQAVQPMEISGKPNAASGSHAGDDWSLCGYFVQTFKWQGSAFVHRTYRRIFFANKAV